MKKVFQALFLLILALFSLGQLQRIQLTEVLAFYIYDIVLLIWLILSIVKFPDQWIKLVKRMTKNKLLLLTLSWICFGIVINYAIAGFSTIPLLYLLRAFAYCLFGLSLIFIKPFSRKSQVKLWIMVGLLIGFWGLLQYLFFPDTRFLKYLGWDDHYFRLISTQFDPNFAGIILVITFFLSQTIKVQSGWLKTGISLFFMTTLLLTYSRASYLSFLGSGAFLLLLRFIKSHKINHFLIIIMSLFIIGLPFLPRPAGEGVRLERTASVSSRVESSSSALISLKNYQWLIGKGLFAPLTSQSNASLLNNTAHFPDNLIVFILTSTGVVGLIIFLFILYKFGQNLYHKDIFIFTAFIAILIHSQFNHTLFQPFVWLWLSSLGLSLGKSKT
ncbi:O-antigen ligase family protein [Patescibacteria group bacterium]|nr:O-antigen ligase family protein [Patescibacteria group bacterium]MBU1967497.1 O-antigen ligase family protein [Patescibacteria group bacterium]MBU2543487.1 O-antigen ligase family protein [Patescibacteria group bacterium]